MRLLLVEDEEEIRRVVVAGISARGWTCEAVATATDGLAAAARGDYDVLLFDRRLPDGDGLSMIEQLRRQEIRTPVLMLTTLGSISDRVTGLEGGADDYLAKPFAMDELTARITALHRRAPGTAPPRELKVGDLLVWQDWRGARRAGQRIDLTESEYKLLLLLAESAGRVVTRTAILEQVLGWRAGLDPGTGVVEVAINRLRAKIDKPFPTPLLHTLRGRGYVLSAVRPPGAV